MSKAKILAEMQHDDYKKLLKQFFKPYTCKNTGVEITYNLPDISTTIKFRNITWIAKGVAISPEDCIIDAVTQWIGFISLDEVTIKRIPFVKQKNFEASSLESIFQ